MKICLVTAFPPSRRGLNEYGYHIARREMAEQTFSASLRMTMPQSIRQYQRSFDLHQKTKALEPISRFRRIPSWVPSRSAIFRAAAPRWSPWM